MSPWDLDVLQRHVGREVVYTAPEPIGRAAARYFAVAIGSRNHAYWDLGAAQAAGHTDVVVPPTLLCETNQYVTDRDMREDGFRGHQWDLPIVDCRAVRAGNRYVFHRHAHPDDVITVTWTIMSIAQRTARDGSPLLFVQSSARYVGADGDAIVDNHETLVYQPLAGVA